MAKQVFNDYVNMVKSNSNIVDVARDYIEVIERNGRYIALCPFHNEKTPSFTLDPTKGRFYCYGCHESGDVIRLVCKLAGVEFSEALKILAKRANLSPLELKKVRNASNLNLKADDYEVMKKAYAIYYRNLMHSEHGQKAREYIISRGITLETAKIFGLGLSNMSKQINTALNVTGFPPQRLFDLGLINKPTYDGIDVMQQRLIFPILDENYNVIAFGGRTLNPESKYAKYINTTNTRIFDKSASLYGIQNIVKNNPIIITEGYFDVLALYQAGYKNSVALLGTALTAKHCAKLSNYTQEIILCLDGDTAGITAMGKSAKLLIKNGFTVKVIILPGNMDCADILLQNKALFNDLYNNAINYIDYKFSTLLNDYDLNQSLGKLAFINATITLLSELYSSPIQCACYNETIAKMANIPLEIINAELVNILVKKQPA